MKIIVKIMVFTALCLLTACAQIQAKLDTQVQATTVPDLQAALADAQAAGDADGAACWQDILTYVNSLPTAGSTTAEPVIAGVASALEAARTVANTPAVNFPPIPHQLHKDCAVIVVDAQNVAVKLGVAGLLGVKGANAAAVLKAASAAH